MKGKESVTVPEVNEKTTRPYIAAGSNAREAAYQTIRDKIIRMELKPGEPLSDKQLAEEMNVSRTPVREALILLSASKMVVLRPQIGTFVAAIDTERMEIEQFSRFALEKEVMTQACHQLTDEHRWLYSENLRAFQHYAETEIPDRIGTLLSLDNDFHRIAFTALGKEKNFELMLQTINHVERMRMLSLETMSVEETYRDHETISNALLSGRLPEALEELERHLSRYASNLPSLKEKYPEYFTLSK